MTISVPTSENAALMESLGGVTLVTLDHEKSSVTLQFNCLARFCHSNGKVAQGGFVTAWLDAAMAHAVILTGNGEQNVASLDINVQFLEVVGPGVVTARGWIVRRGRKVVFLAAELHDEAGKLVATASSSGMLVPMPAKQSD